MERLKDNDEDWGLTRIQFASLIRRRLREKYRARVEEDRRQRRAIALVDLPDEAPIAVHRTSSGLLAYQVQCLDVVVTLPWVSIIGSAA